MEVVPNLFHLVKQADWPVGFSEREVSEEFSTASLVSLYGATKLASEQLAREYGAVFGFRVWINRPGAMAGAGELKLAGANALGRCACRDCCPCRAASGLA